MIRVALASQCRHLQRSPRLSASGRSSLRPLSNKAAPPSDSEPSFAKQPFVKERFEPGEWDPNTFTDPFHRPAFKSRAKVISVEEFANRPRTGFQKEFASLEEAGIVLSWLSRDKWDEIYDYYLVLMETMDKESNGVTSHEYAMMVLSKKFHLRKDYVASIVESCHREERLKEEHGDDFLCYDLQKRVDEKTQEHIRNAYDDYSETPPEEFVETPGAPHHNEKSRKFTALDDLEDLSDMMTRAAKRDKDRAQLLLDNKVYIEDVDNSERFVRITNDCADLLNTQENHRDMNNRREDLTPLPAPIRKNAPKHKNRFRFIAHIIDSREQKEMQKIKGKFLRKKKINKMDNTIVEHDGILRAATVEEANLVSWKAPRNTQEFMLKDTKKAWLERAKGKTSGWGRAPVTSPKPNVASPES